MQCHKSKYFRVISHLLKYYQNQIFLFNYVIEVKTPPIYKIHYFPLSYFYFPSSLVFIILIVPNKQFLKLTLLVGFLGQSSKS